MGDRQVVMSEEQFAQLLNAVRSTAAPATDAAMVVQAVLQAMNKREDENRIDITKAWEKAEELAKEKPLSYFECESPTGSTFRAVVMPWRGCPNGRVVRLENYRLPEGLTARKNAKGPKFGSGLRVYNAGAPAQATGDGEQQLAYSREFKDFMYKNFTLRDNEMFVGPHYQPVDAGALVPYLVPGQPSPVVVKAA